MDSSGWPDLKRTSVGWRLAIVCLLAAGLLGPLIATSWYVYALQRESLQESLQLDGERIVRTLANGMVDPVWNLIPDAGRPLLDSVLADDHVFSVNVRSLAQGPFLSAEKGGDSHGALITLEREITHDGIRIGTVQVTLDASRFATTMDNQWSRILIAAGVQALVVFAIAFWVLRLQGRLQRTSLLRETNRRLQQQIAERIEAEQEAKASHDQIHLITNNLPALIAYFDAEVRLRFANRIWLRWHNRALEDSLGMRLKDLRDLQYEKLQPHIDRVLAGEQADFETTLSYADGKTRRIRAVYVPHKSPEGTIEGFFSLAEDITELMEAEEHLRQAQKMEAVGQLTGGVAHDFNNLLSVIQGNAELLAESGGARTEWVQAILRAAGRGAELTQRLLAYSRQQPLQPEPTDLAALVADMSGLLARTLGETIAIETAVGRDLWFVLADPGQVENALLNLAINARDAMPGGGTLKISCSNARLEEGDVGDDAEAPTGEFVALTVQDNGVGMPPEVVERAFEPFFTTKGVGQGSGLGLSMVHGFAKQSGGHVTLESTVGGGTTVALYLPRVERVPAGPEDRAKDTPAGAAQVILVIEDDPEMRELTVTMLLGLGYQVLDVADARAADAVLNNGTKVDLVLSDVVLAGGTSGPAFAAAARQRFPTLRLLFMSGYSADFEVGDSPEETIDGDAPLLSKPFYRSQLAQAVRTALQRP